MREWTVVGVDTSGAERQVKVKAQDESAASSLAEKRGVRAPHSVYVAAPQLDYQSGNGKPAAVADPVAEASRAGARLRTVDGVLSAVGMLAIAAGALVLVAGLLAAGANKDIGIAIEAVAVAIGLAFVGLLTRGAGAAAGMLAVIGERTAAG